MSPHASDPVGTLAEEAARLVRVLTASGEQGAGSDSAERVESHDPSTCAYCPICQVIGFVRDTSPEALEHLNASVTSLTAAARAFVEACGARPPSSGTRDDPGIQNIDLGDQGSWGDDGWD